MQFTNAFIVTLLAALTTKVAGLSAIVPPNNPSSNGPSVDCTERTQCLQAINNVRASQEGLNPIKLPTNWDSLTYPERLFTFINLERISRGLNPLTHLVNTYASQVQTAITDDADPEPPASVTNWGSIWAGGTDLIPLGAMYLWMYYDGPGGDNEDCTTTSTSGCWGHRDNILNAAMNKVDAGAGTDKNGLEGFAALFFEQTAAPTAAQTVLTWADESQKVPS